MASYVLLRPCITQPAVFLRSSTIRTLAMSKRRVVHQPALIVIATGVAGVALGISALKTSTTLHCDDEPASTAFLSLLPVKLASGLEEAALGTCGPVAGSVVKNTIARLFAYFLYGPFVIFECLDDAKLIKVDWPRMGPLYASDAIGRRKAPTTQSICKWIADFWLADVQSTTPFAKGFKAALVHKSQG